MTLPWTNSRFDQNAAHVVAGSGAAATTWDPAATGSGVTLSGGNLTATTNNTTNAFTFSTTTRSSGKLYFELAYSGGVAFNPTTWYASIVDATPSFPTGFVFAQNALWLVNNSSTGVAAALAVSGLAAAIAVDFTNKRIWSNLNSGDWNSNPSANPATNVGGADFTAAVVSGNFNFVINMGDAVGEAVTVNVGTTAFTFTPPSGFSAWG